ncbi:hypothetical protein M407DRAFT_147966 [Tulasnella calospora MUT 4182]|uniref:Uncharacterized protein n=1 Tax=Tulasnella calospora MUT 4182 TaxID=1051891 RepID=A0A0C3Q6J2_9AGAM|nr:hypothetical protein M407DRAFT_147966 [Tulasnella calospora MUT 4182]
MRVLEGGRALVSDRWWLRVSDYDGLGRAMNAHFCSVFRADAEVLAQTARSAAVEDAAASFKPFARADRKIL